MEAIRGRRHYPVLVVITLVVIRLVWHGLRNLFHRGKRKPAASIQ